jgi:drug/metabolite transporter (DMT)-like permease
MSYSRITAYTLLVITAAIWGFAVPIFKVTFESFSPITFLFYRFLLTIVILLPILFIKEKPKLKIRFTKLTGLVILSGVLGSVNIGLLVWGLDNTTSISASLLSSLAPLITVVSAALLLREHVTKYEKIGLIFAFVGTIVFVISSSLLTAETSRSLFAEIIILVANVALVAYVIITKRLLDEGYSALFLTTTMFILGFFLVLPLAFIEHQSLPKLSEAIFLPNIGAHLGIIYAAVFSGGIAYYLYQQGQKRIEASEAVVFNYLSPFFAVPLSLLWLKEQVNLPMFISILVIAIGVFIAEYKRSTRAKINRLSKKA